MLNESRRSQRCSLGLGRMRISGECAMHQLHWNPLDSNSREDSAVQQLVANMPDTQHRIFEERKRYYVAQVCPGSVEMEHNTMRQVHHILDLSVFVDMGNTIIRVWRQGRYVVKSRSPGRWAENIDRRYIQSILRESYWKKSTLSSQLLRKSVFLT